MVNYIGRSVTFVVPAAIVVYIMLPSVFSSPLPPRNISQVEQTAEIKNPEDCLPNQFFSRNNFTCENCTICVQGTEHSPKGQCGYGWGVETTCTLCAKGFFQTGEGYTGLVCSRCVTCDLNVKNRQNCTPTQNAECGPCPPGKYEFLENICLECKENPSHADCLPTSEPTPIKHPASPTLPSSIPLHDSTTPTTPSPLSSPAHNTSNNSDEKGTPTKKLGAFGVIAIVTVIVLCVIVLACLAYKKWKATNTNENVFPTKSPAEESGPLIPTPAPAIATSALVIATPAPAIDTPGPVSATPAPASATPAPAIATPGPVSATPAPVIDTPAPASATPAPAIATPAPVIPTPTLVTAAPINDLLQGASNPGDQPAASLPSDVSNTETSLPRALCSDGGLGGDAMYHNHPNHVPGSPDSAKDNFVFENDDGSVLSLPMDLSSNEL